MRRISRRRYWWRRVVAMPHAVLHSGYHSRYVVNRNDLVGRVPWINGVKTGHTNDARLRPRGLGNAAPHDAAERGPRH